MHIDTCRADAEADADAGVIAIALWDLRPGELKMVQTASLHGTQCVQMAVQPDCLKGRVVCGTSLWGHALERSHGINRKSRISFPVFLSSAAWPSLPKKHYDGLLG